MCGRFARKSTQEILAEWFDLELEEMPLATRPRMLGSRSRPYEKCVG
jgi:putative SOS response-associated peptidase YedK